MRIVEAAEIEVAIEKLCIEANIFLNEDIKNALVRGIEKEESDTGRSVLESLVKNAEIAAQEGLAICQDTGMAVVFIELGQSVQIIGGSLEEAINNGVRKGYRKGYLRNSVVSDPIRRVNTGDNTPAVIHYEITDGDRITIHVAPKGFGSENMSVLKMLKPSDGIEGVKATVINAVSEAGANPCPPVVVGVGIGGTMEKAAMMAKKALMRPVDSSNPDPFYSALEQELLESINKLGIGPAGLGGRITALGVNIEAYPTHIAGLPVAVNIGCHVTRHKSVTL
ncbi:MAG TPA: fumarate hydratase [Clostridiaceae bacterium]|nr:fumarate hydratase [Clostridiaceae bacterium]